MEGGWRIHKSGSELMQWMVGEWRLDGMNGG